MYSRRTFLACVSALALVVTTRELAKAWPVRSEHVVPPDPGFNGGLSQVNTAGNTFPQFLDVMRQATAFEYVGTPTDPTAPPIPILELDAQGYPTELVTGVTGCTTFFPLYTPSEYSGIWVAVWLGAGTWGIAGNIVSESGYPAPSAITSATDAGGRYEFTRDGGGQAPSLTIAVTATAGPGTHIRDMHIFRKDDETEFDAGTLLIPPFSSRLLDLGPGCMRNLGWLGDFQNLNGANVSNMGLWSQRKPTDYFCYSGDQYIPALWAGTATWSSNCASVTKSGFSLTDKTQLHIKFGAPPATTASGGNLYCSVNSGTTGQITYTSHGLAIGDALMMQWAQAVTFAGTSSGSPNVTLTAPPTNPIAEGQLISTDNFPVGTRVLTVNSSTSLTLDQNATATTGAGQYTRLGLPEPLSVGTFYWVIGVPDANTLTISATRGGGAVNVTGDPIVNVPFSPAWMINVESTGWYPLYEVIPWTADATFLGYTNPTSGWVATISFDEATGAWKMAGGQANARHRGIISGVPPEIFIDACIELGMQPWLVMPPYTTYTSDVNAVSDFCDGYIGYARGKQLTTATWLKPVVEGNNELWNTLLAFWGTWAARGYGWALWNTIDDWHNKVYGKQVSLLGQLCASIFSNDRTKYSMICSFQTVGFHNPGTTGHRPFPASNYLFDERTHGLTYIAENGGSPAYLWTDRFCGAPYYLPEEYFDVEIIDKAKAAYIDNRGNTSAIATIVDGFAETALTGTAADTEYTIPFVEQCFTGMKEYAQNMPVGSTVMGIVGYEGAWSPDYVAQVVMTPTTASAASSCVLTLSSGANYATISGNPLTGGMPDCAGMAVTPRDETGMLELNLEGGWGCTFTGGGSPDISVPSNLFWVGATVWPYTNDGNGLPAEITYGNRYFVVYKSGSTIRISATKGGSAINLSTPVNPAAGKSFSFAHENYIASFTGGGSADIVIDPGYGYPECFFSVDDCVVAGSSNGINLPLYNALPPEIAPGEALYVVSRPNSTTFQVSRTKGGSAITFATALAPSQVSFIRGWKVLSTNRGSRTATLDLDTSASSAYVGTSITWTYSSMLINTMLYDTKSAANVGVANDQMYGIWTTLHDPGTFEMEWPSNFIPFGSGTVWSVLDPGVFAPDTPQSLSISAYNA